MIERREKSCKRRPTGVPGISQFSTASNRRDGTVQRFLSVFTRSADGRRKNTRICLETHGVAAAWQRALSIRAAYERSLTTATS